MITSIRKLRDCTSGSALLEAAIIFPLVFMMMFGLIEFGRAYQDYHTADKSMRSAARYLARVPAEATCGWGWENAKDLAIYGTIDPPVDPVPLIREWTADTLQLDRDPACGDDPDEPMVITISATVPIPTSLLTALGMSNTINVFVRHEERHIGG